MQQADSNAKQQIVDRIKNATNILVTVSRDPSVDELSAALGLTLMLNKLDKHATAVFSGKIPPTIDFLKLNKTFENTVDSLRDFIIALDKEKADRLRYKVEEDVVRIFITPYKTTLSQDDLKFSQGDFNVELIIALGVDKKEELDAAVTAHGRILHDAVVVTINSDDNKNSLGEIDWSDGKTSSLCEMLMSLSEALKSNLLDEQIATALLTGLVSATERFRNDHTSPRVMTMAAQLMAAGANQQLIANELEDGDELSPVKPADKAPDGSTKLKEDQSEKLNRSDDSSDKQKPGAKDKTDNKPDNQSEPNDGSLGEIQIEHEARPESVEEPEPASEPDDPDFDEARQVAASVPVAPTLSVDDLKKDLEAANQVINDSSGQIGSTLAPEAKQDSSVEDLLPLPTKESAPPPPEIIKYPSTQLPAGEPTFDSTFNATSTRAEEEKRKDLEDNRNQAILSHESSDVPTSSVNTFAAVQSAGPSSTDIKIAPDRSFSQPDQTQPVTEEHRTPTMAELEAQVKALANPEAEQQSSIDNARVAVNQAIDSDGDPAHNPAASVGAESLGYIESPIKQQTAALEPAPFESAELPPLPDFSSLPSLPGEQPMATQPLPAQSADNLPQPSSQTPAMPSPMQFGSALSPPEDEKPASNEPGQFKLPGQ